MKQAEPRSLKVVVKGISLEVSGTSEEVALALKQFLAEVFKVDHSITGLSPGMAIPISRRYPGTGMVRSPSGRAGR